MISDLTYSHLIKPILNILLPCRLGGAVYLVHGLFHRPLFRLGDGQLRAIGLRPIEMEELAARRIDPLIGMRAEIIALGLQANWPASAALR